MTKLNQEIPKGYKQTELGIIPEDWEVKKFVDITEVLTCGLAATPKYVNESIGKPFLSAQNVQKGKVVYDKYRFIPKELYEQITKHNKPEIGDLLYTRVGAGIGEAGVIEDDFKFGIYVSLTLIRADKGQLHNYYLLYLLNSPKYKFLAKNGQFAGGGVQNLNVQIVREFLIPLPSVKEQAAIAAVLSDTDALIESLEKLITKKRAIKQGAMQQLLTGKKRLPGFSGEWSTINIAKHASLKARIGWQALTTEEYRDIGTHYLVTGTDFIGGRVNWSSCHFVDEWRYRQDRNIQLKNGDVLVTKDGTIGKVGYVENLHGPATLNSGVFVIRPLEEVFVPLFLFYILTSTIFDEFISKITAGSTITHLYQKDFVSFEFLAPEVNEQTAIAAVLFDMDAEIESLEQQLAKYNMLKQGMMQVLLTGKIRLN